MYRYGGIRLSSSSPASATFVESVRVALAMPHCGTVIRDLLRERLGEFRRAA